MRSILRFPILLAALLFIFEACRRPDLSLPSGTRPDGRTVSDREKRYAAVRLGWAIQAGAFAQLENAVRLSNNLNRQGLEATYFKDSDKLYKVRFGDFANREAARYRAESLKTKGILEGYYLVAPESLPASKIGDYRAESSIRKSLVSTAESYLGIPYLWGGTSPETGFDCSGLTQAVYRLNGLSIPRSSKDQFAKGSSVSKNQLRGGDLLFFGTKKSNVTHVAIYIGNGIFIHSPKSGQVIRKENLNTKAWSRQFIGARNYL
jgi:cell wall-associated NlpC family hydrolase